MKILCDIDGVLAQFTEHLSKYLCNRGYEYPIESFTTYNLRDCLDPKHHWLLDAARANKDWCWSVPRYDGAQQFLKYLVAKGHGVHLVTHSWGGAWWDEARTHWVASLLSSPELRNVSWEFCSPEERQKKEGDILIDDNPTAIKGWKTQGKLAIMMLRPWNRQVNTETPLAANYIEAMTIINVADEQSKGNS